MSNPIVQNPKSLRERIPAEHRGTAAFLLILTGSLGIQISAAIVSPLFESLGASRVAALRTLIAAVVLWVLVRPNPLALGKKDACQVLVYALVLSLMSVCFYNAVHYIPLGVAVTFEYLGAFTVALLGVRRLRDGVFALVALVGVVLIAGPTLAGGYHPLGFIWALGAATAMAGYTLYSARLGSASPATSGLKGTALSLALSAMLMLPLSLPAVPELDSGTWFKLALSAIIGVALAYSADNIAGQLTSAAVIGVLFSIDPVVGATVGTVLLGEILTPWSYLGILLVAASGAYIVWRTNRLAIALSAAANGHSTS
ncbi:EamA family transporter [Rothia sp. CCM 9416]|uniref:EamA family transporter n=1 Tax=Rothia sp. CCM 9416 TaxID=3402655 RepID=UPI003AEEB711